MRVTSLIILLAVVGGIAYVLLFQRELLFKKGGELIRSAKGYSPAKSPRDAMEKFLKAIKDRDYSSAAVYCSGEYGDKLKKADTAASELGTSIDKLLRYIDDKGFKTDETTQVLMSLDPFPTNIKVGDVQDAKDKTPAYGIFVVEPLAPMQPFDLNKVKHLDPKMFVVYRHALGIGLNQKLEIKSEGEGDAKIWKIDYPVPPLQHEGIEYLIGHYKSYVEGLNTLRDELRQGRYLKDAIFGELTRVLAASK